jgi:hypothetical protein
MALIHETLAKIMFEIKAIGKDKKNQVQGFKYRGADDIYNALQPLFAANGVFCIPEILSQENAMQETRNGGKMEYTKINLKITYYAQDGSSVSCVVPGAGTDSGDKALGKAMTYAHKYALIQTFCIPTEDTTDGDETSHEFIAPKVAPVEIYNGAAPQKEIIRDLFIKYSVTPDLQGKINGALMSRPMKEAEGIIKGYMSKHG